MEQQQLNFRPHQQQSSLSEPLKAILLKIAMELKKYSWKPNSQTNEIDIFQSHVEMYKEYTWDGENDNPDVELTVTTDLKLENNQQNGVYFLVYNTKYNMFIQGVGGDDKSDDSDLDITFDEQDVSNIGKFQIAAKQINDKLVSLANEYAYEFARENKKQHQDYNNSERHQNFDR